MGPFSRRDRAARRARSRHAAEPVDARRRRVAARRVCRSRAGREARGAGRLPVDRRQAARQRARHVHDHQRLADAAGSARGDGCRGAPVRAPRRARRGDRRAPRDADGRRVGARHVGMLGGADARNRGVHRRRQSRSARAHAEPDRLRERRSHHPEALAQRLRRGRPRGWRARHRGQLGRRARSGARSADGDDLRAGRHGRRSKRRSTSRRSRRSRIRKVCRFSSMRPPRF